MARDPDVTRANNRLAALHKHHPADHPLILAARADLYEATLRRDILAADLNTEQRSRLAALILGVAA